MATPGIPPPIAASAYGPPRAAKIRTSPSPLSPKLRLPDTLASLQQREQQLQEHLQDLLDAQAEGLLAGLGGGADDTTSNGSSTPRGYGFRDRSVSPPATPAKRKVGLRAARRSIWKTIRDLATIKAEEDHLIEGDLILAEEVLTKVARWEQKEEGLTKKIESIVSGAKVDNLQSQASQLAKDIEDTEIRLAQMKTKHRRLMSEISEIENSVQAKLSSYRESLRIVRSDVHQFLERPPQSEHSSAGGDKTFHELPAKRRTLEMANEHWQNEHTALSQRREETETERTALEDGAVVWKEVVTEVAEFERLLREETSQMSTVNLRRKTAQPDIVTLLRSMDRTIESISAKYEIAESRGWNLLVCSIGAELEAFKQGREILQEALDVSKASLSTGSAQELVDMGQPSSSGRKMKPTKELLEFDADDESGKTEDELLTQKSSSPNRSTAQIQYPEAENELLTRKTRLPVIGGSRLSASVSLRGSSQLNRSKAPVRTYVNSNSGDESRSSRSPKHEIDTD